MLKKGLVSVVVILLSQQVRGNNPFKWKPWELRAHQGELCGHLPEHLYKDCAESAKDHYNWRGAARYYKHAEKRAEEKIYNCKKEKEELEEKIKTCTCLSQEEKDELESKKQQEEMDKQFEDEIAEYEKEYAALEAQHNANLDNAKNPFNDDYSDPDGDESEEESDNESDADGEYESNADDESEGNADDCSDGALSGEVNGITVSAPINECIVDPRDPNLSIIVKCNKESEIPEIWEYHAKECKGEHMWWDTENEYAQDHWIYFESFGFKVCESACKGVNAEHESDSRRL